MQNEALKGKWTCSVPLFLSSTSSFQSLLENEQRDEKICSLSASLFDKEKQEVRGQEVLEGRSVQTYVTDRE
ncbi:hypothetical protein CHI09_15470, partial [Shouchella clausii]